MKKHQLKKKKEETKTDSTNYVAVIKIPKIGLEKGLCEKGSYCNNVNRNIQIMKESTYPDIANCTFILAGHSGSGKVAFFKNLYKLSQDDEVSIFYQVKEYKYKVVNIYDIEKTGTANIIRNKEKTTMERSAVEIAVFISSIFSAPNSCEITTEQPIPVPTAIMTKSIVIAVDAPTAASASAPTSFPTIIESTRL